MLRHRTLLAATAIAAALATPAFALTATMPTADQAQVDAAVVMAPGSIAASDIIGSEALNGLVGDTSRIGEVTDLLIAGDGTVTAVVVEVGGFLGIGAKDVAVPYAEVGWTIRDGRAHPVVTAPAEALEAMPDFDKTAYLPSAVPLLDGGTTGSVGSSANELLTTENMVGSTVTGIDGSSIGSVSDVVLTADGSVDAVIVDVGGFLGIGSKPVAVGFDQLAFATDGNGLMVLGTGITRDDLESRPAFDPSAWQAD